MRLAAALALASAVVAAPMMAAGTGAGTGTATAAPWAPCDSAGCVPYVARNVAVGQACLSGATRFVFGLDSSGRTLICPTRNSWVAASKQLIGVRTPRQPCDAQAGGMAQSPDGMPMTCIAGGWQPDFTQIYY